MSTYIPHTETRMVAEWRDRTSGVRSIAQAKIRWLTIHAVSRSGRYLMRTLTRGAMLGGGLGVNPIFSSSGDSTRSGRSTDPAKVRMENTTRLRLPIRPISPRVSVDCLTCSGAE